MAGTISISADNLYRNKHTGKAFRVLTVGFVADASDGSVPSLTIGDAALGPGAKEILHGWNFYAMDTICNHGGTEVTEDSDVTLTQNSVDLLDGNGTDQLDNTANRRIYSAIDGQAAENPVFADLVLTISGNSVNSATGTLYLIFT